MNLWPIRKEIQAAAGGHKNYKTDTNCKSGAITRIDRLIKSEWLAGSERFRADDSEFPQKYKNGPEGKLNALCDPGGDSYNCIGPNLLLNTGNYAEKLPRCISALVMGKAAESSILRSTCWKIQKVRKTAVHSWEPLTPHVAVFLHLVGYNKLDTRVVHHPMPHIVYISETQNNQNPSSVIWT